MPAERTRFALVAACAALSVGFTALTATPALADGSPVGIGPVMTYQGERGDFSVPVWTDASGAALSSVTATLRSGDTVVADGIALADEGSGRWSVPDNALLKLTEDGGPIPQLGDYAIDITATDDQSNTATRTDAGTLDFNLVPAIRTADDGSYGFTVSRIPTRDDKNIVASGRLVGIQPGSGDLVPLAGRTVRLTRAYDYDSPSVDTAFPVTADADGRFTSGDIDIAEQGSLSADFSEHTADVDGSTDAVEAVYPKATPVTVTATANRVRVLPGQTVTITGDVRTNTDSTGVGGALVKVGFSGTGIKPVIATADAAGHFTATLTVVEGAYISSWSAYEDDPYLYGTTSAGGSLVVPDSSEFRKVKSAISADVKVTFSGSLVRTYDHDEGMYGQTVRLEYSKNGVDGWDKLATTTTSDDGSFKVSAWGALDGHYRVRHATTDNLAGSESAPVRLTRTNTRVFSISATPAKVAKGGTVTVKGTLKEYRSGSWKAYAGQKVYLYFQKKGSTSWTYITSGKTGSTGVAKLKGKATKDGYWLIQYFGDAKHFDSDGVKDYVDVR